MIQLLSFLYGVFIGLPDLAVPVGPTHVRGDDILVVVLFMAALLQGRRYDRFERRIVTVWLMFFFYGLLSFILLSMEGMGSFRISPNSYNLVRAVGCMFLILTLLRLNDEKAVRALLAGLLVGGLVAAGQIIFRYQYYSGLLAEAQDIYEIKDAIGFSSYNPNAMGLLAYTFLFYYMVSTTRFKRKYLFYGAAAVMCVIPFITYTRTAAVAILIAFVVFNMLQGRLSARNAFFALLVVGTLLYLSTRQAYLFQNATDIDFSTGEGFSGRYPLWKAGLAIFRQSPVWGHGMGSEYFRFTQYGIGAMSHNSYLSAMVEGGVVGLFLLLLPFFLVAREIRRLKKETRDFTLDLSLGFMAGLFAMSMTSSNLYWNKLTSIFFAVMVLNLEQVRRSVSESPGPVPEAGVQGNVPGGAPAESAS